MKRLFFVLIMATSLSVLSYAQSNESQEAQRPQVRGPRMEMPPASPQNALKFAFKPDMKFVDRVMYGAYAEANANVTSTDVVFIGDSITQNWYTFHHDFFDLNGFLARGIGGQTSISVLCRFRQDVIKNNPKVVALMIGTNDVAQNDGVIADENYIDNVVAMCDQAKANNIHVLLCSIPPCDLLGWNQEVKPGPEIIRLNKILKEYADATDGITYVDYFPVIGNGKDGLKDEFTTDRCHPTAEAYCEMERHIVKEIQKVLGTDKEYYVTPR